MGGAVHEPAPACLCTDVWDVKKTVLSRGSGVIVMIPVQADLTGDALGLTRGNNFIKEAEGLELEELREQTEIMTRGT